MRRLCGLARQLLHLLHPLSRPRARPNRSWRVAILVGTVACAAWAASEASAQVDADRAAGYFEEARQLCERDGGELWGVSLCGPMVFADATTHTLATNRPQPSEEWPRALGYANAATRWGEQRWSTYVWQMIPAADRQARGRLLIHELFHRVQFGLGFITPNGDMSHLDTLDGRIWMQLEWRALREALASTDSDRAAAVRDALAFRARRHGLFPKAREAERLEEIREGLAQYTGTVIAAPSLAAAVADGIDQLDRAPQQPSFVRTAAYTTGMAYGLLLDASSPGWTRRIGPDDDLTTALVAAAQWQPINDLDAAAARYGGDELLAAEQAREEEHLRRVAELRAVFVEGAVVVVPRGGNASFLTTGSVAIPDAGTTLANYRVAGRWGELEAEMVLVSDDGATLIVPGPPQIDGLSASGPTWRLSLAPGWTIAPGPRAGDFTVRQEPE